MNYQGISVFTNQPVEITVQGGYALRMPEQTLWSEYHQRYPGFFLHMVPQCMEQVCRSGWIDDMHVAAGSQAQESFNPCTGVLRPLALEPMGQEENQAIHNTPLFFST